MFYNFRTFYFLLLYSNYLLLTFKFQCLTSDALLLKKKVREKSRKCHNHKPQPFPDPKRKRKPTNPNKHKSKKRTKSTKISSLFPKRGNRYTKRTEKHKNKMTHGTTYNKSPRRINRKATKNKTNTGTKPKTYRQAPTHWLKFYEEAVIGSNFRLFTFNISLLSSNFLIKTYYL